MECFHVRGQHDLMSVSPRSHEKETETERNRCVAEGFTGDRRRSAPVTGRLWDFPLGYVQNSIMTPVTSCTFLFSFLLIRFRKLWALRQNKDYMDTTQHCISMSSTLIFYTVLTIPGTHTQAEMDSFRQNTVAEEEKKKPGTVWYDTLRKDTNN